VKKWNKKRLFLFFLFVLVPLIPFSYVQNNVLTITKLKVQSAKIPSRFDGYRIVQLSDLHSHSFGERQHRLAERVKQEKPDIIVYTGDLIDLRKGGASAGYELMEEMVKIAPVYFVTGNHEWHVFEEQEKRLQAISVQVLRNEGTSLQRGGETIRLFGIDDPMMTGTEEALEKARPPAGQPSLYTILLSHRPELFSLYEKAGMDLVFSGHAHGGQIRLPFVGGLYAPGQGFLPDYTAGAYTRGSSTMIVSRGLGNSLAPQRIFNRPEMIVAVLKRAQ